MPTLRGGAANVPSAGSSSPQDFRLRAFQHPRHALACAVTHSRRGSYAMTRHVFVTLAATMGSAAAIGASAAYAQSSTGQITVLYDAFGNTSTMQKDWGDSALIG